MTHPAQPTGIYYVVFALLLVLTGATVGAAFTDLGPLSAIVAIGIATAKALLVAYFFMDLRHGSRLPAFIIAASILWLVLLVGLTMIETASRQ
ncbi:MAG TPA: cytochrome C oxidase subunit IV family protein [Planctomycetota bacterium]|nr:cytochrome C oxidase subunit IV family protein [Planctomycetota bacterium]